jgi:malonate decarboxylase alpha subunit
VCGAIGKLCPAERATQLLEAIIEPGDRVVIEGDDQKQADFLAAALAKADPARLHDLHMVQSVLALPDHLVFERGIANRFDFAFAGPQAGGSRRASASRWRSPSASPLLQQPTDDRP